MLTRTSAKNIDIDAEKWHAHPPVDQGFSAIFGTIQGRVERPDVARLRIETHEGFLNLWGTIHGGFLLAVVDQALFVGPTVSGRPSIGGSTIDVSSQFLSPVQPGQAIEVVTEVLRETGQLVFVRGLIEQAGEAKVSFSGTIRKPR